MSGFDINDPKFVETYDDIPLWSAATGQLLLDSVRCRPNLRVLDVGCGTGFPLVELAERLGATCEVTGVDTWRPAIERACLKIARRGVAGARAIVADANMLPFDDGRFDQIVSNLGVNNFADPARAMRESRRVAKRGAEIAIATNVEETMAELYSAYREALARMGLRDAGERIERLVSARTSSAKLAALLDASGFEVARMSQGTFTMRFCDSGALFRHSLIRVGFLDAWRDAVDEASREEALTALGARLDEIAKERDGLTLTIPIVCMVGRAA